jgi:hypothetical protein
MRRGERSGTGWLREKEGEKVNGYLDHENSEDIILKNLLIPLNFTPYYANSNLKPLLQHKFRIAAQIYDLLFFCRYCAGVPTVPIACFRKIEGESTAC